MPPFHRLRTLLISRKSERGSTSGETPVSPALLQSNVAGLHDHDVSHEGSGIHRWAGTRLVAVLAIVAVVSLGAGAGVMRFIISPAELAARTAAPTPGPVTAAVEQRIIENTIVARGEVTYDDPVSVTINAESGDRPVVTGHVPEVGAVLEAGAVALEVTGRPTIVLPGALPAYRTLSLGLSGPDVLQLKAALAQLGWFSGDLESDLYDIHVAAAVSALYEHAGYAPADGGQPANDALRSAQRGLRSAQTAAVQAQATLDEARAAGEPNTIAEEAALSAAREAIADAQEDLADAQVAVQTRLPAGEVLFLNGLPRRVDEVAVKRGDIVAASPMRVSGATLTLTGTFSQADAALLSEGMVAYYPGPDGSELQATVQRIEALQNKPTSEKQANLDTPSGTATGSTTQAGGNRSKIFFALRDLTPEQVESLRGTNVKIRIPVSATDGEVLAVPIAALSAGPAGESRVEIVTDPQGGADAHTELITVETGLTADGFVAIQTEDPRVVTGANVVVGR